MNDQDTEVKRPQWAKKKIDFRSMHGTENALAGLNLNTVCHQARCPNVSECYGRGTATFLILGDTCTRSCTFCNVKKGLPGKIDGTEPGRVVEGVRRLGLKYVVITSVTRDDLPDGGASVFADIIKGIGNGCPGTKVEVLVPDFKGDQKAIEKVMDARPHVYAHNVETVPSMYHIRKGADYSRSLGVLKHVKEKDPMMLTKSAIMLGLGETRQQVRETLKDLNDSGCDFVSIGQYLRPDKEHQPVKEYISPEMFDEYRVMALKIGFKHAESGVWVRSSYMADKYEK